MAATASEYRPEILHEGTSEADSRKALIGIPSATEAVLKTRFFLDWIWTFRKDGVDGFIGGCTIDSPNYNMHAPARRWTGRGVSPTGQTVQWFNDAGFNVYGIAEINTIEVAWANYVVLNISYNSAWFSNSTGIGIRFRAVGSGAWSIYNFTGSPPQQQSITSDRMFITPFSPGQNMEVQAFITNEEGTFYSPSTNVLLGDNINQFETFFRTAPCVEGSATRAIWLTESSYNDLDTVPENTAAITDVWFYKDVKLTIPADDGWYYGLDGKKSYNSVNGMVQQYVMCIDEPTLGNLYLSFLMDVNNNRTLIANIDTVSSTPVTISGRIDLDPHLATPDGANFSITIPAGQFEGTDPNFSLFMFPGFQYYWQNVPTAIQGYTVHTQPIF